MAFLKTLVFLGAVYSKVLAIKAPLPGYGVADLAWNIHLAPGETPINLNGTIEQITSQMNDINPRWVQDLEARKPLPVDAAHVQARDQYLKFYCGGPYGWWYAETSHIKEGIKYLSKVPGKPRSGPGPKKCARVSCSYLAAIWWCNDKSEDIELSSFAEIADAARIIVEKCPMGIFGQYVRGQAFLPADWNVIVRRDTDSC
ncbi:uncharacterized protein CPUR_00503 [Claviceps purpurea 20.1]|uniref:Uncharacterized protein n=1 Tax=Claviceps purpurea (strain 20.1) TaxID=1111077 RepID=M1VY96_CLAP2|nr:uncharacterized protein CPUR_00503 [Claviceps purpurea 20.1]